MPPSSATHCPQCHQLVPDDARFCNRCGHPFAPPPPVQTDATLPIGSLLHQGRYRVDGLLGTGGMGTVYRATDLRLQRTAAVKLLHAELTAHPTARRRMEQEASALARIDHPNVVAVRNVFEEHGLLAIELEFMSGGDLLSKTPPGGMPEALAVRTLCGVLAGLQALHEAGLVHRDVKPDNILIAADGTPKLTDLGVARDAQAAERTQLGTVLGTPEYMAPEQIQGLQVDARADLYAAGMVLYRAMTGGLPFAATTEFEWKLAHVKEPPNLAPLRAKATPGLAAVVARALAKSPGARFASADEMRRALEALQQRPATPRPTAPRPAVPRPMKSDAEGTQFVSAVGYVESKDPRSERSVAAGAMLLGLDDQNFSKLHALRRGEQSLGRATDADIRIAGEGVSRKHCIVNWRADGIWLTDLGSVNGSQVNGKRVDGTVRLRTGETIRLGDAMFRLLWEQA